MHCIYLFRKRPWLNANLEDMKASVNACSPVLWGMVERYPAGKSYRDIFDKLSSLVLNERDGMGDLSREMVTSEIDSDPSRMTDQLLAQMYEAASPTVVDALSYGFDGNFG